MARVKNLAILFFGPCCTFSGSLVTAEFATSNELAVAKPRSSDWTHEYACMEKLYGLQKKGLPATFMPFGPLSFSSPESQAKWQGHPGVARFGTFGKRRGLFVLKKDGARFYPGPKAAGDVYTNEGTYQIDTGNGDTIYWEQQINTYRFMVRYRRPDV